MSSGDGNGTPATTVDSPIELTASLAGDERGPPAPTDPLPLRDPGRYLICEEHARGGIGRILRAEDRDLDRELAIKELLTDDDASRARFVREARLTARLEHPGIVPVHDAGRWIGSERPFYAMKLVGGRALKSVVARTCSLEERLPLLRHIVAIAEAIAYAHSRGIIHRDLTPNNVMIGEYGETVVIDWGLAKEVGVADPIAGEHGPSPGSDDVTRAGSILGTPAFMAPEQARGQVVDERADVYALGALLYYALSGSPLYDPEPGDFLKRVANEAPVPLRRREPRVSADLVAIVSKATARDPAARYPTARELATDLRRYQEGKLVEAHAYTPWELTVRWLRQRRFAAALTAVFVCVLATGGIVSFLREQRLRLAAEGERRNAEAQSLALLEEYGRRELDAGRPRRAEGYLADALRRAPDRVELRWLLAQATRPARAHLGILGTLERDVITAGFSPDGALLATGSGDRKVRLWDVEARKEKMVLHGHERALEDVVFSPDGTLLASADAGKAIRLWRVADGSSLHVLPGDGFRLAFSPDGAQLWAGGKRGKIMVWDVASGRELAALDAHQDRVSGFVFQGDRVLSTSWDGKLTVWDAHGFTAQRTLVDHRASIWFAAASPDGKLVLTGDEEGTIAVRDAVTLEPLHFIHATAASHATSAWFAPPGDTVITVSADGTLRQWHLTSGQPLLTIDTVGHGKVFDGAYAAKTGLLATASLRTIDLWRLAPASDFRLLGGGALGISELGPAELTGDGRRLIAPRRGAAGDALIRIWDAATGEVVGEWREEGYPSSLAVTRDGGRIATASYDGAPPRLWDAQGKLIARLTGHERLVYNLAMSPDDRLIASASYDRTVRLWRAEDGVPTGVVITTSVRPTAVAFDPARPRLAVSDEDGAVTFYALDGTKQTSFTAHPTWIEDVEFSRDGTHLVTAGRQDHTARIWDLAAPGRSIDLSGHADNLNRASFSPDGRVVATVSVDDTARVWDAATGHLLRTFPGPSTTAAFSADGRELFTTGLKDYNVAWRLTSD